MKATRVILDEHENDIDKLKEAESWLFADVPARAQGGRIGLPNAGTSSDEGKTMRCCRTLAGLDDSDEK